MIHTSLADVCVCSEECQFRFWDSILQIIHGEKQPFYKDGLQPENTQLISSSGVPPM